MDFSTFFSRAETTKSQKLILRMSLIWHYPILGARNWSKWFSSSATLVVLPLLCRFRFDCGHSSSFFRPSVKPAWSKIIWSKPATSMFVSIVSSMSLFIINLKNYIGKHNNINMLNWLLKWRWWWCSGHVRRYHSSFTVGSFSTCLCARLRTCIVSDIVAWRILRW